MKTYTFVSNKSYLTQQVGGILAAIAIPSYGFQQVLFNPTGRE